MDACDPATIDACARALDDARGGPLGDGVDRRLVCRPEQRVCVVPCSDGPCPTGWTCNALPTPYCEPGECRVPG